MSDDDSSDSEREETLPIEDEEVENDEDQNDDDAQTGKRKRKRKRKKKTNESKADGSDDESDQPQHNDSVDCTIYVEGIPFDSSDEALKEFFVSNGIEDIVEMRLPKWQDSGRLRGYGHVLFASEASFKKALDLSGKHLGKRYLTIQEANTPKGGSRPRVNNDPPPKDCNTLFVHNLPYNATEDEIAKVFELHGNLAEDGVRIARNSVTRQSKGFAYIDFETPKDAQNVMKACAKKPLLVGGRMVRLDYDTGRMKGSFRAQSGRLWTKEHSVDKRQRVD